MKTVHLCAIVVITVFSSAKTLAYSTTIVNGITWTYTVSNGEASVGGETYSTAVPTSTSGAITIPSTLGKYPVTSIGRSAFSLCGGLTSITIPDSVMSIGNSAFYNCSGLTSITIPDSVMSIGNSAFNNCSGLTSVAIGNSVTSIGYYAFSNCTNLMSVTIGDSVTSIGDEAFYNCGGLASVTIPDSVTSIGDSAFSSCSGLTSVTIGDSVTSIGDEAFKNCSGLTSVTIGNNVTNIGQSAFSGCSGLTSVTIPDSVTSIGGGAFSGCGGLISVTIPDSVMSIGYSAFNNCSGLTSVTIPDSVTNIGQSAFSNCTNLMSVTIGDSVTSIGIDAFYNCSGLTSVTIPDSVTSIGSSAFSSCSCLTSVTIPNSVTSIGGYAFRYCNGLYDTNTIPGVRLVDGWAMDTNGVPILSGALDLTGVRGIGGNAFSGCSGLTSVTIGNSVTSIGNSAFLGCSGLTAIAIPSGVTSIGGYAFYGCSGLASVTIPDSVTSIGDNAFTDCSGFTSVTIPDSVMSIGYSAFNGCSSLTSVTIPNSVTSIGNNAFSGCIALKSILLPRRFQGKTSSMSIRLGCSIVFYDMVSLTISSDYGTAVPEVGTNSFKSVDTVECSMQTGVVADEANVDIRHVCTGWRGTGSVPASGTGTNVTFSIMEDSSLTWLWRKENAIRVSVTDGGTCGFGEQWVADGTTATATIIPDTHLFSISLSGDTDGVALSGTTLSIPSDRPREITVTVKEVKLSLDVATEHGSASPTGCTEWSWGDTVAVSVIADDPADGVRHVCTGWCGMGSVPSRGTGTNVTFEIEEDSSLAWLWRKENAIRVSVTDGGTCGFGEQWVADGTTATATIVPATHLYSISLYGDTDGVALSGTTLSIPSDRPREITVTVEEVKLLLDVATEHGAASPTGRTEWSWGDTVAVSVAESEPTNGIQYVCTGWCGTGSVPSRGTGTNVTFSIMKDSSLTWLWRTNVWMECTVSGDAVAEPVAEWRQKDGDALAVPFAIDSVLFGWSLDGDVDGVTVDDAEKRISIPADSPHCIAVRFVSVETAVGTDGKPLAWNGADAGWRPAFDENAPGGSCLRSGDTAANSASAVSATVSGSGRLSFNWRISAGRGDTCALYVDGTREKIITRASNWATATVELGDGEHSLEWVYSRGSGSASGEDAAFIDNVDWRPDVTLTVASAFGEASPMAGAHTFAYGDTVTANVAEPADSNGVRRICTGWTGTGSAPSCGTGTEVAFAITNDSSIVWNWRTDYRIAVAAEGPVSVDFSEGWLESGDTQIVRWTPNVPYYTVALAGDAGGAELDESARTLAIPADKPQNVSLVVTELTLEGALDGLGLAWTTDGVSPWFPQTEMSEDGDDAAASGIVADGDSVSALQTTVEGAGTFAWSWRLDAAAGGNCGVDVLLDDVWLDSYWPDAEWASETLEIEDEGEHTIRFEFWNAGTAEHISDCAYLDCVSWTPEGGAEPISPLPTNAAPEAVTNAIESAGFDAGNAATLQDAISGDAAKYNEFKTWAQAVKGGDGETAGEAAVVASERASISYLLGTDTLIADDIESDDVHITGFSIDHGAESSGGDLLVRGSNRRRGDWLFARHRRVLAEEELEEGHRHRRGDEA